MQIWLTSRAYEKSHVAPAFIVIQTIERVTGRHARFAACAGVEVDFKRILLARTGLGERNEMGEALADGFMIVLIGEQCDGSAQSLLFTKYFIYDS